MNLRIYLLLQIPGLIIATVILIGVGQWFNLPLWIIIGLLALWIAKDLALYPFIRASCNSDIKSGLSLLIGKRGVVREAIDPKGYVQVVGELWQAKASKEDHTIPSGRAVRVREARGLTLVVDEIDDDRRSPVADRRHPEEETRR